MALWGTRAAGSDGQSNGWIGGGQIGVPAELGAKRDGKGGRRRQGPTSATAPPDGLEMGDAGNTNAGAAGDAAHPVGQHRSNSGGAHTLEEAAAR